MAENGTPKGQERMRTGANADFPAWQGRFGLLAESGNEGRHSRPKRKDPRHAQMQLFGKLRDE